jgi:flavin reductase
MTAADPELPDAFRQAMRRVASTVNVITICVGGEPMGITATAMSSISVEPPSLLVCINRTASLHGRMEDVSHFRVNVLHRDQEEVARIFADRKHQALRFADGWTVDCERPPRLVDAQASLLCRRIDHHRFGTHSIFIGQVEEVAVREDVKPLVYVNGAYAAAG